MLASKAKLTTLAVRLLGVLIGAFLIVLVVVPLLGPCWHLLYGDAISFQQWTIPVPKGFYVHKSRNGPVMWKQTFGVPFFNVSYGHISFFLRPPGEPFLFEKDYIQFKNGLAQDAKEKGFKLTSERTVSAGKEPAYCLEFRRSSPEPASLLRCAVESTTIVMFYEGDPRYIPDVFATLQGTSADSARGTVYLYDEENEHRLCLRRRTPLPSDFHKLTGKERNSESGLDDFDARHYPSSMGRFVTPDWWRNRWAYWSAPWIRSLDHTTFVACERDLSSGVARSAEPDERRSCRANTAGV